MFFHFPETIVKQPPINFHFCKLLLSAYFVFKERWFCIMFCLASNCTFSLPLIKSGSPNWPWSTTNIRSVRNSHSQELTLILKIIGQCDVKHILTSPIKTIMPAGLAAILAIMYASTFQTAVILYLLHMLYTFVCINKTSI